jgi:hypothetical protein
MLAACQASSADESVPPRPQPSASDLAKALNASYQAVPGSHQECIGRLTFNVDRPIKWALSASTREAKDQMPTVTREIRSGDERLDYSAGRFLDVLIYPGATPAQMEAQYQEAVDAKIYVAREIKDRIDLMERALADVREIARERPDPRISQEDYRRGIKEREQEIAAAKQRLAENGSRSHDLDFDMPDRKGYAQGRNLLGFLWRDGVYFRFEMSSNSTDKRSDAEREAWFADVIKRFKTRKLYEVPKERGVCVPYGFFPDDGTVPFHTVAGFRYDDRPNVLYVINTQLVGRTPVDNTLFIATSRAAVGLMAGFANEEVAKVLKHRIGPHRTYIGELAAEQGGAVVRLSEGKRQFDNYSVYTGYMGWMDSHILPFVAVDMRSFTRAETARSAIEELKTDPPPFEESKARLDGLLKSIRLRRTEPPMLVLP